MNKLVGILLFLSITVSLAAQTPDAQTFNTTAREAYIYGLPLVLTDLTRIGSGKPDNVFDHLKIFPDHTFKLVVRPNNDTYYSIAYLDLGKGPQILDIPDTKGRYAVIPLMDAYTNVFASFGKRTTGTGAQRYLITGPKWKGRVAKDLTEVKAPTDLVWIIGRVQVNSPEDGKNIVGPIQDGLKLTAYLKNDEAATITNQSAVKYSIENTDLIKELKQKKISVVEALKRLTTEEYFNYLNELLVKNPGTAADQPALEKFAAIGIKPGAKFTAAAYSNEVQDGLKVLPQQIIALLDGARTVVTGKNEQKPDTTIAHYGTDYRKRAAVAWFGLGALGPEDAVYLGYTADQDKQPLNGNNKYVIHFEKGQTPPARAFWSITLYDKEGYLAENSIRRYAIGDRSNLKYNADGSLDIFIQHENPGAEKEANWLPAPADTFNLSVRIYWAADAYLKTGNWTKPPIVKQ